MSNEPNAPDENAPETPAAAPAAPPAPAAREPAKVATVDGWWVVKSDLGHRVVAKADTRAEAEAAVKNHTRARSVTGFAASKAPVKGDTVLVDGRLTTYDPE